MFNLFTMFIILNLILFIIILVPSNLMFFHPLMLSILLTIYVIIVSLLMNFINSNYWYSYILFLIMIGGLMILFMYFTSIASNDLINFNLNYLKYFLFKMFLVLMILLLIIFFFDKKLMYLNNFLEIFSMINSYKDLMDFSAKNLFMDFSMDLNMYMIMYLFMTMMSCVLLCMKIMLPFRQLNYYD